MFQGKCFDRLLLADLINRAGGCSPGRISSGVRLMTEFGKSASLNLRRALRLALAACMLLNTLPAQARGAVPGDSSRRAGRDGGPARTPPMGWNSWDSYGTTVTE